MDQLPNLSVSDKEESRDNAEITQNRVVSSPAQHANVFRSEGFLLDPEDPFADQSMVEDRGPPTNDTSFSELMKKDFSNESNEWSAKYFSGDAGDADLYAIPSGGIASDIQSPPFNPQLQTQEHSEATPADTSHPQPQIQQHVRDTPVNEWGSQAQLQQESQNTPMKNSTSQPQVAQMFSPHVAIPGAQRQLPRYNQQPMYTEPNYTQEASFPQVLGKYRNQALNLLSPSSTLSIIDGLFYTFSQELQWALEREHERQQKLYFSGYVAAQNDLAMQEALRSQLMNSYPPNIGPLAQHVSQAPYGMGHTDPSMNQYPQNPVPLARPISDAPYGKGHMMLPTPGPTANSSTAPRQAPINSLLALTNLHHEEPDEPNESEESEAETEEGEKPKNKRRLNIKNFDASQFYIPLATTPVSWGSQNEKGLPIFRYTKDGELDPLLTFTPAQIIEYISQRPLGRDLKLWIQTVPADSGRRYPNKASEKCRFAGCPDRLRTIRKGDFRVCFDEQASRVEPHDPFHNAGYVHLFCLEKFLDFPDLCKNHNVQPDVRKLPEGKNRMAITRDHPSMEGIVKSFITNSQPWRAFGNGTRPKDYYPHTLNYQLTMEHLDKQPQHLQKIRRRRGGVTIDLHKNNLELYVEMRAKHKANKTRNAGPAKSNKGKKRRRRDESSSEEEDESGDDILDSNILQRAMNSGGQRPSKRPKLDPKFRF